MGAVAVANTPVAANNKTTSGTTLAFTVGAAGLPVDAHVEIVASWDNIASTTLPSVSSVTVSSGAIGSLLTTEHNTSSASAGSGCRGAIVGFLVTTAIPAGATVTLNLSNGVTAKAGLMFAHTGVLNAYRGTPQVGVNSTLLPALSLTGMTSGDLILNMYDQANATNVGGMDWLSFTSGGSAATNVNMGASADVTSLGASNGTRSTNNGGEILLAFQQAPPPAAVVGQVGVPIF